MATTKVIDILDRATIILQDNTNVRFPNEELLKFFNDAQREVVLHRPDAKMVNIAFNLATGSKQTPAPLAEGGTYSDATLTVLSSKNIAKTEIRFSNVYPISLGSLSYDITASDVYYLQVQASFNYLNYDIVQISTT